MAMWIDRHTVVLASGVRTNREGYEMVESELRRMGVTDVLHMQIPYGHAHIDGLLNMASHDVAMIHASQVPYDVCDALKKKGIKLLPKLQQWDCHVLDLSPHILQLLYLRCYASLQIENEEDGYSV